MGKNQPGFVKATDEHNTGMTYLQFPYLILDT